MLNLYAGRENIDKERFIYGCIRQSGDGALVIVPDQYTLIAEEQAMRHLGTDCLFDVEILSMNRLGMRVLTEKGLESVKMLDKYGRFMLLSRLIRAHIEDFTIYRRSAGKLSFVSMLNDFISEFKQNDCSPDDIGRMLEDCRDDLLRAKLMELGGVISDYEREIAGRFTDSEDYIALYIREMRDSAAVTGKKIWIYGYDSITARFRNAVIALAGCAEVNMIINRSDGSLDEDLVRRLRRACGDAGIDVNLYEINDLTREGMNDCRIRTSETITRIEKGLFSLNPADGSGDDNSDFVPSDLTMVRAANPYYEAETAASYIWHLVRDRGFRFREIQVIANDEGTMHPIIGRVFREYGLPVFMDSSRDITDSAPVAFIVSLLQFLVYSGSSRYLFAMLKTGLTDIDTDLVEELENYARNYHIRGSMWERDFKYGEDQVGSDMLADLNDIRSDIMNKIRPLRELAAGKPPAGEFAAGLAGYLEDVWNLSSRTELAAEAVDEGGRHDETQRMLQSYDRSIELLGQISEIMGDEPLDLREFTDVYTAGLAGVEVGVIPPSADGLSVGTMIRTRPRPVRAVVVLGANEGILPMMPSTEGLFSQDEKEYFKSVDFELGLLDDIKAEEEQAAMYRLFSRPSEKLYVSWSVSDADGSDASPSQVIDSLKSLFPMIEKKDMILRDVVTSGWGSSELTRRGSISEMLKNLSVSATECKNIDNEESRGEDTALTEGAAASDGSGIKKDINKEENSTNDAAHTEGAAASDDAIIGKEANNKEERVIAVAHSEKNSGPDDPGTDITLTVYSGSSVPGDSIVTDKEAMRQLITRLKDRNAPAEPDLQTQALLRWFHDNRRSELEMMLRAASDGNAPAPLGREMARALYGRSDGTLRLSASSISSYFDCPFRYYIDRGLRPREEREFSGDPRSIGDAYHECLMRVAMALLADRESLARFREDDEDAREELDRMVSDELSRIASVYRGGVFASAGNERFRMDRIREVCSGAARAMARQLSAETLVDAGFEESFSRTGRFRPVSLDVDGVRVYVEGKIDRADILDVDGTRRVRIIDYKTGSDTLNIWKMRSGFRMQLMIYMISASSESLEPAGMFYFNIKDSIEGADSKSVKQMDAIEERTAEDIYKLRGRYIDEPGVLGAMPEEVLYAPRSSKDRCLTREEYEAVRDDVVKRISETASDILNGRLDIRPLREGGRLRCIGCGYRSVCRRDRDYPANRFREIPPEPVD